jgi:hypothetical protein
MVHTTEIATSLRIGFGPRRLGFNYGSVVIGEAIEDAPKNRPSRAGLSDKGDAMNVCIISWDLFWEASSKQHSAGLDKWLDRWFSLTTQYDVSMRPTIQGGLGACSRPGLNNEKNIHLATADDQTRQDLNR